MHPIAISCILLQVKSQGVLCKSSWAFSAAGALEAQYRKVWGRLIALSEQQLIDCSKTFGNKGCGGGTVQSAFRYVNQAGGICDENNYSYLGYVRLLIFWTCMCVTVRACVRCLVCVWGGRVRFLLCVWLWLWLCGCVCVCACTCAYVRVAPCYLLGFRLFAVAPRSELVSSFPEPDV